VHPEVRISCVHQQGRWAKKKRKKKKRKEPKINAAVLAPAWKPRGAKTTVVRTPGGCTLREIIVTLFGTKQMQQLMPFDRQFPDNGPKVRGNKKRK
jgi:hypothetical protein